MRQSVIQRHPILFALLVLVTLAGFAHLLEHVAHCGDQSGTCHFCQAASALLPIVAVLSIGFILPITGRVWIPASSHADSISPGSISSRAPPRA